MDVWDSVNAKLDRALELVGSKQISLLQQMTELRRETQRLNRDVIIGGMVLGILLIVAIPLIEMRFMAP